MTVIEKYANNIYARHSRVYSYWINITVWHHYPQNIRQWAADKILLELVRREYNDRCSTRDWRYASINMIIKGY